MSETIVHELPVPQTLPHLRARCGLPADTIRSGDQVHHFASTDHPEDVTCVGCLAVAEVDALRAERDALISQRDTPEIRDFVTAVIREADHQWARWGEEHDARKSPADWFWTIGYLGSKALHAFVLGDRAKGLHHIITTAAALANWHRIEITKEYGDDA